MILKSVVFESCFFLLLLEIVIRHPNTMCKTVSPDFFEKINNGGKFTSPSRFQRIVSTRLDLDEYVTLPFHKASLGQLSYRVDRVDSYHKRYKTDFLIF